MLHEPCKLLQLLQTLSLRNQGDTTDCNPLGSQRVVAAHPPRPGEFGDQPPHLGLDVQLVLDIRDQSPCLLWYLWWRLGGFGTSSL